MEQIRRQRRDANAWRALVTRFTESGLTVPEFCEREGIGAVSFYRWRSRLSARRVRRKEPRSARPALPAAKGGFLDLGTLAPSPSRMEVRLDLGGGVVVHVVRS